MKKILFLAVFGAMATGMANAQALQANGHIKNESGEAVASALVQVADTKVSTYTDANGYFEIPSDANASIIVVAKGYKDEVVTPKKDLEVTLKKGRSTSAQLTLNDPNKIKGDDVTMNQNKGFSYFQVGGTDRQSGGGGMFFNVSRKEDTQGSRYLVEGWAPGYVIQANGNTINNEDYSYNYDKIGGNLLVTQDKHAAVEVDRHQVKNFTIYNKGIPETYKVVAGVDSMHYSRVLSSGSNYNLYKYTKTKFVKSDYRTDGMTSTGNRYDEYVDEPNYYVQNAKTGQVVKIALKGKAIKQAFAADADKVKSYFDEHKDDDINEAFLIDLAASLN